MVLTIFTIIVFISQLIILCAIITQLLKLDKSINKANLFLQEAKRKIEAITKLVRRIPEQMIELAEIFTDNLRKTWDKVIVAKIESLIIILLFWKINTKFVQKIKKSKLLKIVFKGLSMFQYMV